MGCFARARQSGISPVFTEPQYCHGLNIADAAIVCEAPHKTLTTLYDLIVDAPHPAHAADCLRIGPWLVDDLCEPLREFTISDLMQFASLMEGIPLLVSVDDSLTERDKGTTCLEGVDWHYDHAKSQGKKSVYTNAYRGGQLLRQATVGFG